MQRKLLSILIVLLAVMLSNSLYAATHTSKVNIYTGVRRVVQVIVEVADTYETMEQGLMYRESLGEAEGILFVFWDNSKWSIWMKNILIPLDIIFISKDFRVIDYVEGAQPCKVPSCTDYYPEEDAMYVLEVNAGFIKQYGIEEGSVIEIE